MSDRQKHHFDQHMAAIKAINVEAFKYLESISACNWSRNAFTTRYKSVKMIEKGMKNMSNMRVNQADLFEFEVDDDGDTFVVNLQQKSRLQYEEFVHQAYHVSTYAATYAPIFKAMPGYKQWETQPYLKPLPPPYRKMLGRLRHYKSKCQNVTQPPQEKSKGGRPRATPPASEAPPVTTLTTPTPATTSTLVPTSTSASGPSTSTTTTTTARAHKGKRKAATTSTAAAPSSSGVSTRAAKARQAATTTSTARKTKKTSSLAAITAKNDVVNSSQASTTAVTSA
ncbi:mucin-5AC-like [Chenopodium quinoa]|uniref:mucin-5AC-like n=1 Tax=Chenopodium quinoa TaxID=63459 RepID=UPI000B7965F4|nr:mucin-5AC-like [Chenopodium quinoa]